MYRQPILFWSSVFGVRKFCKQHLDLYVIMTSIDDIGLAMRLFAKYEHEYNRNKTSQANFEYHDYKLEAYGVPS